MRWLRVFMLEFIGLGEAFQKRLWCADVFWKHSEASLFFSEKKAIGTWKSCSFAVFWVWCLSIQDNDNIGPVEESSFEKVNIFWFLHLTVVIYTPTVDKPYVSLCEHGRHKLGHVETAFLPCQDSLAAVEFGNTLAKEFSGPGVWWVVGWLDEKVLSLFLFDFQFFFVCDLFFQKWWVESGQHSKEFRPEFSLVNQYK